MFVLFFFFKQKTAYVMRISDWSSDVCSSDLPTSERGDGKWKGRRTEVATNTAIAIRNRVRFTLGNRTATTADTPMAATPKQASARAQPRALAPMARSDARRIGKECVRTCRSRWSTYQSNTPTHTTPPSTTYHIDQT